MSDEDEDEDEDHGHTQGRSLGGANCNSRLSDLKLPGVRSLSVQ